MAAKRTSASPASLAGWLTSSVKASAAGLVGLLLFSPYHIGISVSRVLVRDIGISATAVKQLQAPGLGTLDARNVQHIGRIVP